MLGTLETKSCIKPDVDELLKVNQSVTSLLDSVSQNQMILKNKMDKALHALSEVCSKPPKPPCPHDYPCLHEQLCVDRCKCSAVFRAEKKCELLCAGSALAWDIEHLHGKCFCIDPCDKTRIKLCSKGRFSVSFSVNVKTSGCKRNAAISLQMIKDRRHTNIYTTHSSMICNDTTVTISMSGVIIENFDCTSFLLIKLESPDSLSIEDAMLNIIEI